MPKPRSFAVRRTPAYFGWIHIGEHQARLPPACCTQTYADPSAKPFFQSVA